MGGKSRPSGPSAADTRKQMQRYWQNVQTWRNDINQRYNRQMATTRTRMAAGGIKTGTDEWNRQLKSLEESRTKALKDIEAGATYQQLSSWAQSQQGAQRRAASNSRARQTSPQDLDFTEMGPRGRPRGSQEPELDFVEMGPRGRPRGSQEPELDFVEMGPRSRQSAGQSGEQSGEQSPLLGVDDYLAQQFGTFTGTSGGAAATGDGARGRRAAASGAGQRRSPWWG